MVNVKSLQPHALLGGAPGTPTPALACRNPHFKHNALLTQGPEVHAQTKVNPGCKQTAHTTGTNKPKIKVQTWEQSKLGLCRLEVSGCYSAIRQTLHSLFPTISIDNCSNNG